MFKILFAVVLLSGSTHLFAYDSADSNEPMENKVTGTYPEAKEESMLGRDKWRAGLTTGVNSPKGDINSSIEYGVTTAFQPLGNFGFGLDAGTSRLDDVNRFQRTVVMVNGLYNFGGDIPVLRTSYVGIGGGPIFLSNTVKWGYAPLAGFDIPLSNMKHDFLSLGVTAKYLINPSTPNSLSAGAALKYWF